MAAVEASAQQQAAVEAARRVLVAYRAVFGVNDTVPNKDQQALVLADMRARARVDTPIFVVGSDGQLDPLKAAIAEGARMFFLQILEFLKTDPEARQNLPVVKK